MLRSAAGKDMGDANGTAPVAQTGIAAFAHARKHSPITDPLVSFGRPSLFGAAVANTRDKSPRTIQHRPACLGSSHIQIQYPSDPVDALVTER